MTILRTYLFLIPLVVLVLCEFTKLGVTYLRTGGWKEGLFQPGGFPSSHSAFVTSLLMVVSHKIGATSPEFAIAFVYASITWYDAINVRHQLGHQAEILNRLQKWEHLKTRLGHSFVEVCGGIAFGLAVTQLGIWVW